LKDTLYQTLLQSTRDQFPDLSGVSHFRYLMFAPLFYDLIYIKNLSYQLSERKMGFEEKLAKLLS
jgi:hypothetical protein